MIEMTLRLDPIRARVIAGDYGRVVLVANHPSISSEAVAKLALSSKDVLVQFNKPASFDLLKDVECHKVHILNAHGDGGYWGFTPEGEPDPDIRAQRHGELTVYFTRWLSSAAKTFLGTLSGSYSGGVIADQWEPSLFPYPAGRLPSVGFMAVSYYRGINLLRISTGRKPLPLVLFGFSGNYPPGQSWNQHDFAYEQLVYQTLLDLTRIKPTGFLI